MEIMDDLLDLKDTLADAVDRHRRRARKALAGQSGFSTLITVLAIMAVGAIIITPLLAFVITGTRAGAVHDRNTDRLYAADAGIQDGIWRVTDGNYPESWKAIWNEAVHSDSTSYSLPALNGCDIAVTLQPVWLLTGLEEPSGAQGRTPDSRLVTTSNVLQSGSMQVVIIMNASIQSTTQINRIGVWLPQGFSYVRGSSSLEQASGAAKCNNVSVQDWKNGHVIIFDYPTPVSFTSFPNVTGDRLVVGFSYTGAGAPSASWAWSRTNNDICYLSWSNDIKMFQVKSTATDPVSGASTSVVAGQMVCESVGTYLAYYGDYAVTGNALMRETGSDRVRDRLYKESPGEISVIPTSGTARKIILYWSGWKEQPDDAWFGQTNPDPTTWPADKQAALRALAPVYGVTRVSVRAVYNSNSYDLGTVTATDWTVLPNGSSSNKNGWSYGCNADITNLVKGTLPQGFVGNATYWVGHRTGTALPSSQDMYGIWGTSASNIFMAGGSGRILKYDGASWTEKTGPNSIDMSGIWGSSATDVWAVGARRAVRRLLFFTDYYYTVWHSTNGGGTWTDVLTSATDNARDLNAIWGYNSSNIWAVGAGGTIMKYNGTSWSAQTSGTTKDLYGIWGYDSSNIWAVGASGTIMKYNGTSWSAQTSGTTETLYGVWGNSASGLWAAGSGGKIVRTTNGGTNWSAQTSGSTATLRGIWGYNSSSIWAVGSGGTILNYNGGTWATQSSSYSAQLNGAWGTSATSVYACGAAVGSVSSLLYWDGTLWERTGGPTTNLWGWANNHGSDSSNVAKTAFPLSDVVNNEWANACWSIVTLYTSPVTEAHQMYLFNTFRYWNSNDTKQFTLDGFLAPQGINDEDEAVKLSYFVGEGDGWYGDGDNIYLNNSKLTPTRISPSSAAPDGNAMNSVSNSGGITNYPPDDGIDLDTYVIPGSAHLINPRDSSALLRLTTATDVWNMVYMILSFRSDNVGSGVLTYILI